MERDKHLDRTLIYRSHPMFLRLLPLALLLLATATPAMAQNYIRVTTCGTASPPAGASAGYMDANGNICSTGSGSSVATAVTIKPSSSASDGITSVVSASAEATHVLKNAAGNLYSVSATNLTSVPGFLAVVNATAAPADGAITPLACAALPASGGVSISFGNIPSVYSTGITAIVTSATSCFTKTTGTLTAYISGVVK